MKELESILFEIVDENIKKISKCIAISLLHEMVSEAYRNHAAGLSFEECFGKMLKDLEDCQ